MKIPKSFYRSELTILLILLPFLKAYGVTLSPELDKVFKLWKIVSAGYIATMFLYRGQRLTRFTLLGCLFCAIWGISLLLNTGSLGDNFQQILSIVMVCLFCDTFYTSRHEEAKILGAFSLLAKCNVLLNALTVVLQRSLFGTPEIDYLRYWLGGDNYWAFILIVYCGLMLASDQVRCQRINTNTWCFVGMALFSLVYLKVYTGLASMLLCLMLLWLFRRRRYVKIFCVKNVLAMMVLFVLGASYLDFQSLLMPLFEAVGKTVGFNSREYIWPMAINAIIRKPILGWGKLMPHQLGLIYGATEHTHNSILEILFSSGLVGGCCFGIWMSKVRGTITQINHIAHYRYLYAALIAYLVCSIFDFYIGLVDLYVLMACMYHTLKLEKEEESAFSPEWENQKGTVLDE